MIRDDIHLVRRDLASRPVPTFVAILVVGLAISLLVAVSHLNDGLQRGIIRASDPFGVLVIGAKGSAQQLVLSTLLLQGVPVGNIPEATHDRLLEDPRVALAVPLAFGDNVNGARLIGTEPSFLELSSSPGSGPSFRIDQGRMWQDDHELVLGSRAAAETRLAIGDVVLPGHGVEEGLEADVHAVPHTVVGIMAPSGTAFDGAVLTSVHSVIAVHEGEAEHEDEAEHEGHAITAVLVRPTGFGEANALWQEAYAGTQVQAVFPGQELGGVFDLLDQAQELLVAVGYLASAMAALTLFLAVYAAGASRDRLLAIMRALGARRSTVFRVVLVEALVVALAGAVVGRLIGTVAAMLIASQVTSTSAIPVEIGWLPDLEVWLWVLPIGLGLLAGLVPALRAYRADVVDRLAAT